MFAADRPARVHQQQQRRRQQLKPIDELLLSSVLAVALEFVWMQIIQLPRAEMCCVCCVSLVASLGPPVECSEVPLACAAMTRLGRARNHY